MTNCPSVEGCSPPWLLGTRDDDMESADQFAGNTYPLAIDALVGRASEIAEIASLIATARLITLTGTGGVGKTRLAVQVAAASQDTFQNGVRWVELDSLADPALLPNLVASRCGVTVRAGAMVMDALATRLRRQHLLLVLDNCEHLLPACASLVQSLLSTCPQLHFLATSREPLAIPGEVTWLVKPLTVPGEEKTVSCEDMLRFDAVSLFVDRAKGTLPGFTLTAANTHVVAQICRRVEGLPLALELAASWLRALSVEEIAARMEHVVQFLTRGARTVPGRHQTLRATLDWSYHLLDDAERSVFNRLAVFSGSFTANAAEVVCAGPEVGEADVLPALARLVDKSLVIVHDRAVETRYRLLEPLRQYAQEQRAAGGDPNDAYRRHRDWFLSLAAEASKGLAGPGQGRWLDRLESEHDNLRAVLGRSLAHGDPAGAAELAAVIWQFWLMRGHLHEGRDWLERILAMVPEPTPMRAHLLWVAGILDRPHAKVAERHFSESLHIWRTLGSREGEARLLGSLGFLTQACGEHERAIAYLKQGRTLSDGDTDLATLARIETGLGLSVLALGRTEAAAVHCLRARALFQQLGDAGGDAAAAANLGLVYLVTGRDDLAEPLWQESLDVRRRLGDHGAAAHVLALLGSLETRRGDHDRATDLFLESWELRRQSGGEDGLAPVFEGLSAIATAQGDAVRATNLAGAAAALRTTTGEPPHSWEQDALDNTLGTLRAILAPDAFTQAWNDGEVLALGGDLTITPMVVAGDTPPPHVKRGGQAVRESPPPTLTPRETEVLRLLTFGQTYAQIGEALAISPRTVDAHIRAIFAKLDVHSRSAATRIALMEQLV
jgi:non-specific serine/threonine protein kinase